MLRLRKLLVPRFDHLLLVEALFVLGITRIGLSFCHFQRVRRLSLSIGDCGRRITRCRVSPDILVRVIETARGKTPLRLTCLTVALTAEALFKQFGHEPVLCIGASLNNGEFSAHAWLEINNEVMVGGPETFIQHFTRFPDFIRVL
jgi:hypothetical protein